MSNWLNDATILRFLFFKNNSKTFIPWKQAKEQRPEEPS